MLYLNLFITLKNSCLIDFNMINPSEIIANFGDLCFLCERCIIENKKSDSKWDCKDKNSTPFIRAKIFYDGRRLCKKKTHNADCVYKYKNSNLIAIEIKAQPLKNIDSDNLAKKIINCYNSANSCKLTLVAFILQLSSIENSSKNKYQLLLKCEKDLNANNIHLGKGEKLKGRNGLKISNVKFDIVKCKEFDERYFNKLIKP